MRIKSHSLFVCRPPFKGNIGFLKGETFPSLPICRKNTESSGKISYGYNSRSVSAIVENMEGKFDHHMTWTQDFLHGGSPLDGRNNVTSIVARSDGARD